MRQNVKAVSLLQTSATRRGIRPAAICKCRTKTTHRRFVIFFSAATFEHPAPLFTWPQISSSPNERSALCRCLRQSPRRHNSAAPCTNNHTLAVLYYIDTKVRWKLSPTTRQNSGPTRWPRGSSYCRTVCRTSTGDRSGRASWQGARASARVKGGRSLVRQSEWKSRNLSPLPLSLSFSLSLYPPCFQDTIIYPSPFLSLRLMHCPTRTHAKSVHKYI